MGTLPRIRALKALVFAGIATALVASSLQVLPPSAGGLLPSLSQARASAQTVSPPNCGFPQGGTYGSPAISRVSVGAGGAQTNGSSAYPSLSSDGRHVAYLSAATNLTPGDTNAVQDVFVTDRATGQTARATVGNGNLQANNSSGIGTISDDGSKVAFATTANNLQGGDTDTSYRSYDTGEEVRLPPYALSRSTTETVELWFNTLEPGPLVGYANTVPPYTPTQYVPVLYVDWDGKLRGQFWHGAVSPITAAKTVTDGTWHHAVLTSYGGVYQFLYLDGVYQGYIYGAINHLSMHWVSIGAAFSSSPWPRLDPYPPRWLNLGRLGHIDEVAIYTKYLDGNQVAAHHAARTSGYAAAVGADGPFGYWRLGEPYNAQTVVDSSGNGQHGWYLTNAGKGLGLSGALIVDQNGRDDVYVRDLRNNTTSLVSAGLNGAQANWSSYAGDISLDGKLVTFMSGATNLVPETAGSSVSGQVFVRDMSKGETSVVSLNNDSTPANLGANSPRMSADGQYVTFTSYSTNLAPNDSPWTLDVFVRDRTNETTTLVSADATGRPLGESQSPDISADGRFVTYYSSSPSLVPGDTNGQVDVFLYDIVERRTVKVSGGMGGAQTNGGSYSPAISGDGRYVSYSTLATNVVPNDTNNAADVIVWDRLTGQSMVVNRNPNGDPSNGGGAVSYLLPPSLSRDGSKVAFTASSTDLVPNDTNAQPDVFLLDQASSGFPLAPTLTGELVAQSDEVGLEQFYPYKSMPLGTGTAYTQLRTGNLVAQFEDESIPGQGLNAVIRHTYNSQRSTNDTGLGPGWSLSVADVDSGLDSMLGDVGDLTGALGDLDLTRALNVINLGQLQDGVWQALGQAVEFTDADGTTHRFVRNGAPCSGWQSPPGVSLKLREEMDPASGSLVTRALEFVRPDGVVYRAEPVTVGLLGVPTWRVVSVSDRNGNKLSYEYTATGLGVVAPLLGPVRLKSIRHNRFPTEPLAEFTYSGDRLVKIVTLPRLNAPDYGAANEASREWERSTLFEYQPDGQLARVTQNADGPAADQRKTTFGYENGRLSSVTDGRNNTTKFEYDPNWRVSVVRDREAQPWTFTYGAMSIQTQEQVTTFKDPLNHVSDYAISERAKLADGRWAGGNIVRITDAGTDAGPVTKRYTWSKNRMISSSTDGANDTRRFEYNDLGLLTKVVEPPPNDPSRTDLPSGAPTGEIVNVIEYEYPPQFRYPVYPNQSQQPCTSPSPPSTEPVSDSGRCFMVANMLRTTFASTTTGASRVTEFVPDERGNITSVTQKGDTANPDRRTRFTYYDFGGLETVNGPRSDIKASFGVGRATDPAYGGYDRTGQPRRIVDPLGKQKSFEYTPYGLVAKVEDRDGRVTRNTYDAYRKLLKVVDPLGDETSYAYDKNNQQLEEVSAGGKVTTTTYNPNDRVTSVRGPITRTRPEAEAPVVSTEWNADGTKKAERNPLGGQTEFTYWPNGSTHEVKTPATGTTKAVTSYSYDVAGRLKTITSPVSSESGSRPKETVTYAPNGGISTSTATSPVTADAVTAHAYNAHGEEIEVRGPRTEGTTPARVTNTYTPFGEVATTAKALAGQSPLTTTYRYDLAGNQIGAKQPGQNEAQVRYDALGQVTWRSDPQNPGHETDFTYSGEGQQLTRVDRGLNTTARRTVFTYNRDGTRSSSVAVQGTKVLATCNFAAGTALANRSSGYDDDGNLLITRTVDWEDFPGATTDLEGKACNDGGRTIATQTLAHDDRNFLSRTTQTIALPGEASVSRTQVITSNKARQWEDVTLREGATETGAVKSAIDFAYDASGSGWLTGLSGLGHSTSNTYLPSGGPLTSTLSAPTNIVADFDYHRDGSLAKLAWSRGGSSLRAHTAIGYDVGALRTAEHVRLSQPNGSVTEGDATFGYDLADRLKSWDDPLAAGGVITFTLDDAGNVEKETAANGTVIADPVYDANGRLVSRGSVTFTYDDLGQEVARTGSTTTYDAGGHARTKTEGATVTTTYYDGTDRLIGRVETTNGTKTVTLYFSWGTGSSLAEETDGTGATKVLYLSEPDGEAAGQQATDGGWTWLLVDAAGNVGTRVADDGTVAEQKAYDPYGKPSAGTAKGAGAKESTLGFQGHIVDPKSGSVVLGARLYDPGIRRFTTADTFVASSLDVALGTDPLTGNRYLFAGANPVSFYDNGHWGIPKIVKSLAKKALPALSVVPFVGTGIEAVSVATGRDWLEGGRKMSGSERLMRVGMLGVAAVTGGAAGGIAAKVAGKAAKELDKADNVVRAASKQADDVAGVACRANSFVPETPVLMADGTTKPIAAVAAGDVVWASDPETGEQGARTVTDTIVGHGTKTLVEIEIDGSVVVATDAHPLWVEGRGWTDAAQLHVGDRLRAADGTAPRVSSLKVRVVADRTVHNLTVDDVHTYYAGDEPVLVHNCRRGPKVWPSGPHNEKILERAQQLAKENYSDIRHRGEGGELTIRMKGLKGVMRSSRRPDIAATRPDGSPYYEQVGRVMKSGEPVPREVLAMNDIEIATGVRPVFTPYNR